MAQEEKVRSTAGFGLQLNGMDRITGSATVGVARAMEGARLTGYWGVGAAASASVNWRPHYGQPISSPSAVPTYRDRINVPQADAFLNDVAAYTQGSYDAKQLTIGQVENLVNRYPAVVSEKSHERADHIEDVIADVTQTVQRAQKQLQNLAQSEIFPYLPKQVQQQVLEVTKTPFDRATLDAITVGQIYQVSQQVVTAIDKADGAQGITQTIGDKMPSWGKPSASQLEEVRKGIQTVYDQAADVVHQVDGAPSAEQIKSDKAYIEKIMAYDPVLRATAYVAAGASYALTPSGGAHVALGGSVEAGKYADADNAFLRRGVEGKYKTVHPSTITSSMVAVGVGTSPTAALPPEMIGKLGLVAPPNRTEFGVYASHQQNSETLAGVRIGNERVSTIAAQAIHGLSADGRFAYASIGVSDRHDALVPGAGGKKTEVQVGVKF